MLLEVTKLAFKTNNANIKQGNDKCGERRCNKNLTNIYKGG